MSEAIKTFETLNTNSVFSLIILKGNLSYVLKKYMFMFIKYIIVTNVQVPACFKCNFYVKPKWKTVKNFEAA